MSRRQKNLYIFERIEASAKTGNKAGGRGRGINVAPVWPLVPCEH